MKEKNGPGTLEELLQEEKGNLLILCSPSAFPGAARELLTSLVKGPGRKVFFGKLSFVREAGLKRAIDSYFIDQMELIRSLLRRPYEIENLTAFLRGCDVVVFFGYCRLFGFLKESGLYYRFMESLQEKRVILAEIAPDGTEKEHLPWKELIDVEEAVMVGESGISKRCKLI